MFGFSDLIGIGLARMETKDKYAMFGVGLLAILATKGRALDDVAKAEAIAAKGEAKGLVNLTEETFSQALYNGAESIGGYSIYGTKGLVGNTFNRNIFLLEASETKSLSGFRSLVGGTRKGGSKCWS